MDVHDGLAAVLAAVVDDAVAVLEPQLLRNDRDLLKDMGDDIAVLCVDRVCAAVMLLRDEEHMHGRHRVEVVDRDDAVVLIDLVRGDLSRGYLTKNAV